MLTRGHEAYSGRVAHACLAVLLFLLAGCAARTTGAAALPDHELSGHLLTTENGSWFRACGADPESALVWVTFTGRSVGQIGAARVNGIGLVGDTVFVRWRAAPTDESLVGPGGPALLVRGISEVRPVDESDCGSETAIHTKSIDRAGSQIILSPRSAQVAVPAHTDAGDL